MIEYYFLLKAVRRRLSKLNRGIVRSDALAELPQSAIKQGTALYAIVSKNKKRVIKQTKDPTAALITDPSMDGWGAVFLPDTGNIGIAGGKWNPTPLLMMQAEARAVRLGLEAFAERIPIHLGIWVDNTSLLGAAKKESSKSYALTWELTRIFALLDRYGTRAIFKYVQSDMNPADGISRGAKFSDCDLAKGFSTCEGGAAGVRWTWNP